MPSLENADELLVVEDAQHVLTSLSGDDWQVRLERVGAKRALRFGEPQDGVGIARLIQTALTVGFESSGTYWRIIESARYWYGREPIATANGIAMYRGVSFATQVLSHGRISVAIDVRHLFLTQSTIAGILDRGEHARSRFDRLRKRGEGGKGTLLYDTGKQMLSKCYFSDFSEGAICRSVRGFTIGNDSYSSLLDYYQKRHPRLGVIADDSVVYVSFPGFDRPKPVAAKLLRLRVSLDKRDMPKAFRRVAMAPAERRQAITQTWFEVGEAAVKRLGCQGSVELWRPGEGDCEQLPCPDLLFGGGRTVRGPTQASSDDYRKYFSARVRQLRGGVLYHFEPSLEKELRIVTPAATSGGWPEELQRAFVEEFTGCLSDISRLNFRVTLVRESDCQQIAERLRGEQPSAALVVFDERQADGAAYYLLSHELHEWQFKRITRRVLESAWCNRREARGETAKLRAKRDWDDIILHSVLDTLCRMDAIPWRLCTWQYDACLTIDVSDRRRFFALALLLCRDDGLLPGLWRYADAWPKPDPGHDTINSVILQDKIAQIPAEYSGTRFAPIRSLLVVRDGRSSSAEEAAVRRGLDRWMKGGQLLQNAVIHFVECHKRSVKDMRLWDVGPNGVRNVLEGRAVYLDEHSALVACTGGATLPWNVTAEPSLIVGRPGVDIRRAARAIFSLTQLNFASPKRAQRDPHPLREADALLRERMAAETRGLR